MRGCDKRLQSVELTVFFPPTGRFVQRVNIPQQPFIIGKRGKDIRRIPLGYKKLVFQSKAANSGNSGIGLDAEEHTRL